MGLFDLFKKEKQKVQGNTHQSSMTNIEDCIDAYKNINGWEIVASFSVGGFEWLGFSEEQPNKMTCISSHKTTIVNCDSGKMEECVAEYDEEELIAICDAFPNEQIKIVGQYGGKLSLISGFGEEIIIQRTSDCIMTITFVDSKGKEMVIYNNYDAYVCGFSYDGNYFVIADDGGIDILKRQGNH